MTDALFFTGLADTVAAALREDIGSGDITAQLIPADQNARARVICRETAVICGRPWVDEVFRQCAPETRIHWEVNEGDLCAPDSVIFRLSGPARQILTAERSALNFLQTLSATATRSHHYQQLVADTGLTVLDTRKTLPGLRLAQKYAVKTGGCSNHRIGLYDAFLIKENHIAACGGVKEAVAAARHAEPGRPVEIEVETLDELQEALSAAADIIMLDNFDNSQLRQAVKITAGRAKLEASGGYSDSDLPALAATGVDYVSIGALTKHCRAIDFSLRLED